MSASWSNIIITRHRPALLHMSFLVPSWNARPILPPSRPSRTIHNRRYVPVHFFFFKINQSKFILILRCDADLAAGGNRTSFKVLVSHLCSSIFPTQVWICCSYQFEFGDHAHSLCLVNDQVWYQLTTTNFPSSLTYSMHKTNKQVMGAFPLSLSHISYVWLVGWHTHWGAWA